MSYLEIPTFDTLKDNFSYSEVSKEPMLYLDCWVSWDGRISNSNVNADGSYTCQLLVGYETMKNVDGIVTSLIPVPLKAHVPNFSAIKSLFVKV